MRKIFKLFKDYWELRKILIISNLMSGTLLALFPFIVQNQEILAFISKKDFLSILGIIFVLLICKFY